MTAPRSDKPANPFQIGDMVRVCDDLRNEQGIVEELRNDGTCTIRLVRRGKPMQRRKIIYFEFLKQISRFDF